MKPIKKKFHDLLVYLISGLSGLLLTQQPLDAKTDFDVVGKEMTVMLGNTHFARLDSKDLNERVLKTYLKDLDVGKMYFLQSDVDEFEKKYGDKIDTLLLQKKSMTVANHVYSVFRSRLKSRVEFTEKLLESHDFTFESDRTIARDRSALSWAVDQEASDLLWSKHIENSILSEVLRRESVEKLAKEQDKDEPKDHKKLAPKEKILKRYKRLLQTVEDADEMDISNYFFSAVAKCYDPHSDYFSSREMKRFRDAMKNSFVGIGALLQTEDDGATKIMGIVVGGPADKQGVLALNDRIIGVDPLNDGNMVDTMHMKIDKVVDLIRGKKRTKVGLKIETAGAPGETKIITIERGKVEQKEQNARAEIIDFKTQDQQTIRIGWIMIPSFYLDFEDGDPSVAKHLEQFLIRMNQENVSGLLLDLRGNGGGSLDEVLKMTEFFVGKGPVVQVKDTFGRIETKGRRRSKYRKALFTKPVVVLTDKTSASASEILAGALQDYNRAVIVGESSTFGKGTVQQPMDIGRFFKFFEDGSDAGHVKMTIQKFYRVAGSTTQLRGVVPDVILPAITDALEIGEAHLDYALAHDEIPKAKGYRALKREPLHVSKLISMSQKRVNENQDFIYIKSDVERAKEQLAENKASLNINTRREELNKSRERNKLRKQEMRERFARVEPEDQKRYTFYRMGLEDLAKKELKVIDREKEKEVHMRRAKNEIAELDDTPEWPSGLDPVRREGISILTDLIAFSESSQVVKKAPSPTVLTD